MGHVNVPTFLHDVFGEKPQRGEIIFTLAFGGVLTTALFLAYPDIYEGLPFWRSFVAFLLIFDIFSGCIANFTRSTSNYYAIDHKKRIVFLVIHVHLIVVALLIDVPLWPAVVVWAYTIGGAFIVNGLDKRHQLFVAGSLTAAGLGGIPLFLPLETYMLVVSVLFMVKVLLSFSVDHYGETKENHRYG
ncbi:hypothetical protein P4637_19475 [Halalkalibacterium halodurans]|uniref:hypothetical protein n=1 Tax=Halalkalibacterium halodurans TaxID=86665 RepID=UPI002AAA073A|nr:hypothetical protein [Halalkalibacterium halodurans]MDY7223864.1 hypothetical protein [Halalkalibacterium halodurans]MDY7243085.1 hypothetical protein [Halalkalibacterium halodurans]MED4083098.1 hypothetical protein [Halalkalibacterium halodurans]MED4087000.1 hypothetical protein [Halalkalibacterium halodurans]MED4106666.1 hypothetical protein [Halalkalibacterium halodurans]